MIVIVGAPAWRPGPLAAPDGRACAVALAAAARGARVELVGRIGDDPAGDELVIALARSGVGHAAVLRDPARPTPVVTPSAEPDDSQVLADPADERDRPATSPDGPVLQREDVRLGLSYLGSFSVLVVTDGLPPAIMPACVEGAAFAAARLVVLLREGTPMPDALPAEATVLGVPPGATDVGFAGLVGAYAAGLDGGHDPAAAFGTALGGPGGPPPP